MKYEKPCLEEIEMILEGSFLLTASGPVEIADAEGGDDWE